MTTSASGAARTRTSQPYNHYWIKDVARVRGFLGGRRWLRTEEAWQRLHVADEALIAVAPDCMVRARAPYLLIQAHHCLPSTDGRLDVAKALKTTLDDPALAADLDPSQRFAMASLLHAIHVAYDQSYAGARAFRHIIETALILFTVAIGLLLALAWRSPEWLPLCTTGRGVSGLVPVCPTGGQVPSSGDALLVALIGCIAAGMSAVAAVSRLGPLVDPFHTPLWQGLLKIPIGAFAAILGVLAIERGLDASAGISTTQGGILVMAFIFGYSQQILTKMVDERGSRIRAGLIVTEQPQKAIH